LKGYPIIPRSSRTMAFWVKKLGTGLGKDTDMVNI